jgi:hypothetical protein
MIIDSVKRRRIFDNDYFLRLAHRPDATEPDFLSAIVIRFFAVLYPAFRLHTAQRIGQDVCELPVAHILDLLGRYHFTEADVNLSV